MNGGLIALGIGALVGLFAWLARRMSSLPQVVERGSEPLPAEGPSLFERVAGAGQDIAGELFESIFMKSKELIAGEEGLRLTVYRDPGAGAWTIGWGHLVLPGERFHPYGTVRTITRAEADALFDADLAVARAAVNDFVKVPLTDNQRAALESFVFNVGVSAFRRSTLLKKLNLGDYSGAVAEFDRWVFDDGKRIDGLVARRAREQEVFLA